MKIFYYFLFIAFSFTKNFAAEDPIPTNVLEQEVDIKESKSTNPLANLKTKITKPMDLRDPFKPPAVETNDAKLKDKKTQIINGTYTNIQTLDSINLDNIVVTGVVILSKTNRRAIITSKSTSDAPLVIKEGEKIAEGKVQLKAIFEKSLHFIEEITNVYGQKEILETKVPLSE
ncbi:MAG: hypothetical protein QE271_13710 [Bacteriovoracaceae bacterium]|nr:hypothetical protein [Bacteriovoracaceae bacterium]